MKKKPSITRIAWIKKLLKLKPKIQVIPLFEEDREKAKLMKRVMDYQWESDPEFRLRYFTFVKLQAEKFWQDEAKKVQENIDVLDKYFRKGKV